MRCKNCKKEIKIKFENMLIFEYGVQVKCDKCGSLNDEVEVKYEQKDM